MLAPSGELHDCDCGAAGCSALNLVCGYCYCPCYAGLLLMCSTDATGTATTATAPPPLAGALFTSTVRRWPSATLTVSVHVCVNLVCVCVCAHDPVACVTWCASRGWAG